MNPPPTYVPIIFPSFIRLAHVSAAARERITTTGLIIEAQDGYAGIQFACSGGSFIANQPLVDACRHLNAAGVLFAEDFKQMWSPTDFMRELQDAGQLTDAFTSIAWRGMGNWFVTMHEPSGSV